jgi:CO/xanthine dehydrogenase FAD-binding subunit
VGAYLRPTSLDEALHALAARRWTLLAGGTDFYPARVAKPIVEDVLDLTALPELNAITSDDQGWRIPALCRWSDLLASDLPPLFDGLKQAAREVGGVQIQNAGTIVGNLCNASPAADGTPNLLALDATIEIARRGSSRSMAISDFVRGNRRIALEPDELVLAIRVPRRSGSPRSAFVKLGARRYLVIAIVSVAAVLSIDTGRIVHAAIAVGACAPIPVLLHDIAASLVGVAAHPASITALLAEAGGVEAIAPIDDVRASAAYRREVLLHLVERALLACMP